MIQASELIINPDGTVFHLHLKPGQVADTIILVGDPGRAALIADCFDSIELRVEHREFKTATGYFKGERLSVIATGIGPDNIDIVINELDALFNVDFESREIKADIKHLNLIRIGTSGSLQEEIPVNSWVISKKSVGFDGLLNFYGGRNEVCDLDFELAFIEQCDWSLLLPAPYVSNCSPELFMKMAGEKTFAGVNISAPGFYGPQGRVIRLPLADPELNRKIEEFCYEGERITNFEMESSAIYGLAALMGHQALTICLIIANRVTGEANTNYNPNMKEMVLYVLNHLC